MSLMCFVSFSTDNQWVIDVSRAMSLPCVVILLLFFALLSMNDARVVGVGRALLLHSDVSYVTSFLSSGLSLGNLCWQVDVLLSDVTYVNRFTFGG